MLKSMCNTQTSSKSFFQNLTESTVFNFRGRTPSLFELEELVSTCIRARGLPTQTVRKNIHPAPISNSFFATSLTSQILE